MTGNVRQTAQERVCRPIVAAHEQDTTSDGTGPQNGPEGTVDMVSIDRLRDWWLNKFPIMDKRLGEEFREHLNAIEQEAEELRDRDYRNGREDAEGAAEFADRLCRASERREDVTLWGVDYTAMPVDADGVPIHVGDVLDGYGKTIEVVELRYGRSGWVIVSRDGNGYADCAAFTHHHAPTVEDVLTEMFAKAIERGELTNGAAQTIAEYAAKLTLRGDE